MGAPKKAMSLSRESYKPKVTLDHRHVSIPKIKVIVESSPL